MKSISVAVDTDVLASAEGVNDAAKKAAAIALLESLPPEHTLIQVQALGELYSVLTRKARRRPSAAQAALLSWGDTFPLIETSPDVLASAVDLAADHQLSLWDAVMLAAAAEARCRLLLSGHLQEGFTWRGVTVTSPFARTRHPLVAALAGST